jgi:MoxR-like ATPase
MQADTMLIKHSTKTAVVSLNGDAPGPSPTDLHWFSGLVADLFHEIRLKVVVSEKTLRFVLLGMVSRGHVLLEDTPGVGKTLLAKTLAESVHDSFARVQCTPDLLPTDITGTSVFDMRETRFEFRAGPVFSNILLADEINRASPRTQSALLEAMAEFQVSTDGQVLPLPKPFMVIATQNSAETYGIFPLPDSQLDRFLVRMSLGLPTAAQEVEILDRVEVVAAQTSPVVDSTQVLAMQDVVRGVRVSLPIREYLVNISAATRGIPWSPKG